jgi:DNA-binding transcriptional LysR family regulator
MNQKQITYFLSVYETRSMKKTAEHFFVSPQGISRVIKDMENELGTELFLRSRQQEGLLPTHAAEMLLPHFQNILHEYELIGRQDFLSQPGKYFLEVLVTGGAFGFLGKDFLPSFLLSVPWIQLNFSETVDTMAVHALLQKRIELVLLTGPVETKRFRSTRLFQLSHVFVLHKDHPLAQRQALSLHDLDRQDIILRGRERSFYEMYQNRLLQEGVNANILLETNIKDAMLEFVERNMAIGILFSDEARQIKNPELRILSFDDPMKKSDVYLVELKDHPLSKAARAFKRFILDWCK